jgi:hypothetical protein
MRPEILAEMVAQTIRGAVDPMRLRVAELEAADGRVAIALATVQTSLGDLGTRLAVLEARAGLPGPEGPPGPPGPAGRDGLDGKDARWQYLGVHVTGKTYEIGDLVTDHGSLFYCVRTTTSRPATSPDWQLMVKRGQDGKDARG